MVDTDRAIDVLDSQIAVCLGHSECAEIAEALALAKAALKAQGEPVYQWREKSIDGRNTHFPWQECLKESMEIMAKRGYETRTLYTAPQPESQPAQAVPDEGRLWSWLRELVNEGANIHSDSDRNSWRYEQLSARLDAATTKGIKQLRAMLAAAPAPGGDV